jgi:uncharacterized RDD family membrane protein YckC
MSEDNEPNLPDVPARSPQDARADASWSGARQQDATWGTGAGGMDDPALYDGVMPRRVLAYLIDAAFLFFGSWVIVLILGVLSLGVAFFFVAFIFMALALAYHSGFIAKNAATPGMALMGLRVATMQGGRPDLSQALLNTIVFYVSVVVTVWIVLLVPLLNDRRRTLHDFLAGTVVVRDPGTTSASDPG